MVHSMTAFARQECELETGALSWEVRSLNHRYLEISLRLPEELRALESAVRERINARLGRGKLDCSCRFRPSTSASAPVEINPENLQRLLAACRTVGAQLSESAVLSPLDLLRWPGVVHEVQPDLAPLHQATLELLDRTLDELVETRAREGVKISQALLARCDGMAQQVAQVRALLPDIRSALRRKMETRLAELDVVADPGRLEQELVLQLQKIDVDEELDRLDSHLGEVRRVVGASEPVGRRLDFLMQELNREANTITSKSNDAQVTRHAVEMKVLIEQMREQIQNIE